MSQPASPSLNKKNLACKVFMLDDTEETFHVPHKSKGSVLFEMVVKKLQLLESDYFDLQYMNIEGMLCWLDHEKTITSHLPANSLTFEFVVKFYTPDPGMLEEEYTRYLFALQVKRDLLTGKMPCHDQTAALLLSYIVQADYGDLADEDLELNPEYLRSISHFSQISAELENNIIMHHKEHFGQTPTEADYNLLDTARKVDFYGISLQAAKDHEGMALHLAATHMGVVVFQCNTRINTFSWAKIRKLSFKRKKFLIKLHPEGYGFYRDTVEFYFNSRNECKNFWKRCLEHHAFFRCQSVKKMPRNRTRMVSHGSSFRYSGRTQKQLVDFVRENFVKRPNFHRSTSMRTVSGISRTGTLKSKAGLQDTPGQLSRSRKSEILSPSQPSEKCRQATQSSTLGKIKKDKMAGNNSVSMELVGFMSRSSTTGLPGQAPGFDQSSRSFLESSFPLVEDEYDFEMLKTSSENTKVETSKKNDEVFFNETTTYNVDSPSYIKLEIVKNDRNLRANACKTNSTLHEQFSFDRTFAHPSSSQPPEQLPASPSSPISQLATPKRYCSTELDDLITRSAYLLGHKPQYDHPLRNSSDDLKNMIPSTNIQNLSSCQTSFEDAVKYKDGLSHSNLTTSLAPFSSATFNTTKYPSIPLSFSSNQLPSPFHTSINKIFPPHSDSVEDIFFQTTKNVIYDISRELLSLEVTYTQKLRNAVQVFTSFVDEYADCNDDGREDIKESVGLAEGFLRLLTPLMQCHDDWLPTLKHRLLDWSFCKEEEMQLGDLFARNIPMFRIYELYFNQYDTLMDDVMKHYLNVEDGSFSHLHDTPTSNHQKDQTDVKKMKQNANYVDVLKVVEGSPKCVQLVSCLLLQPYHHLSMLASVIERLKEQCQSSSLDADNLQESSKVISGILKVFERKQSHMENRQQLCEVVQDIKGLGFLMRHQPELVREGCMQLISRTGCQQRLILLFDSCLVVARKEMSVERHFKFTACIPITNIKLVSSKQNQDFNNNNHSHHLKLAITLDHNQVPSSPFADQYFQGALASSLDDKYTYQLNLGSLSFEERSRWHDDLSRVISQARQNSQVTDLKFFVEFFDKMAPLAKDSKRHNDVTSGNQSSRPALVCWHRSCSIGRRDRLSALKNTYSGFVCRQFKGTSTWQSLWVVLCQRCLYFYKSHKDDQPLTCLPLSGYSISCCGKENVGEEFVFEVTYKNHAYLFKCHSEYSFKRWVQVIKSTIETLHPINFP